MCLLNFTNISHQLELNFIHTSNSTRALCALCPGLVPLSGNSGCIGGMSIEQQVYRLPLLRKLVTFSLANCLCIPLKGNSVDATSQPPHLTPNHHPPRSKGFGNVLWLGLCCLSIADFLYCNAETDAYIDIYTLDKNGFSIKKEILSNCYNLNTHCCR